MHQDSPSHWLGRRYELLTMLRREGERRVWKAFDHLWRRPVVLKGACSDDGAAVREELSRLRRLAHPMVVRPLELGQAVLHDARPGGRPFHFFSQEWLPGESLRTLRGTLTPQELELLARQTLQLLAFCHHRGLTRLDLKPEHLLRSGSGWRLIDLDQARTDRPLARAELHGTLAYAAPECLEGFSGGPQADLFSLGALLFEVVTGAPPPLKGGTLEEVRRFLEQSPPPELGPGWAERSPALARLLPRLLARKPHQRPESAERALCAWDDEPDWRASCPLPRPRCIGRTDAVARADALLEAAAGSRGGGLHVCAPEQGGRSRFLEELALEWQGQGRPALYIVPSRMPAELIPFVLEHLRLLDDRAASGAAVPAPQPAVPASGPAGAALPTADTPLGTAGTASGPAGTAPEPFLEPAEQLEQRVCSALQQFLEAGRSACRRLEAPIPLLLDDPDTVDALSREVIRRLEPFLPGSGLFLVLADGSADATAAGGARGPEPQDPAAAGGLPRLELPPLEPAQVQALAEDLLGPAALSSADEAAELVRLTRGYPGRVVDALSLRWRTPEASFAGWTPSDAGDLALRIAGPGLAVHLEGVRALSICDHPFTPTLAGELIGDRPPPLLDALSHSGLLVRTEEPDALEPRYRFTDEAARRGLESGLEPERRRALHRRAAELLESQAMVEAGIRARDVARHYLEADLPDRAVPHLQRAALEARTAFRFSDAEAHLRALLLARHPAPILSELWRQLGEVLLEAGRFQAAREALETALERAGSLPEHRRARCSGDLGEALLRLGRSDEARSRLEAALVLSAAHPPLARHRVRWQHHLAWIAMECRTFDRAADWLRAARSESAALDARLEIDNAQLTGSLELRRGRVSPETEHALARALELARQHGYARGELNVLNCLVQAAWSGQDPGATRDYLEQVLDRSRAMFDLPREAVARQNLGSWLESQGESEAALEQFDRAAALYQRLGNAERELKCRLEAAELLLDNARMERAEALLSRTAGLLASLPVAELPRLAHQLLTCRLRLLRGELPGLEGELEGLDGELEGLDGELEGLEGELEDLEQAFDRLHHPRLRLSARMERMTLVLRTGRPREVLKLYASLEDPEEAPELAPLCRRIHGLAMAAHEALAQRLPHPAGTGTGAPGAARATSPGPLEIPPPPSDPSSSSPAARLGVRDPVSLTLSWLPRLKRLIEVADEEEAMAAELAALVGQALDGRGLVVLFEGSRLLIGRSHRMELEQVDDVSSTLIEWVRTHRSPYVCADVLADRQLGALRSLRAGQVRSLLCHPVLLDNACIGVIYVDHVEAGRASTPQVLDMVAQVAAVTADLLAGLTRRRTIPALEDTRLGLIGVSPPMQRLKARLNELASTRSSDLVVLLLGETGTGKSMIARSLHQGGHRRTGPFVSVNAAAIPDALFESLMFGHEKGTFTGASAARAGWFEMASGGTLFMDEIAEMPLAQQAGLLETLGGARRFRRLGADHDQPLDVHLVCATSRDLKIEAAAGRFRPELLRRIQVNVCKVPALRERGREDIRLLACHMATTYLVDQGVHPAGAPVLRLEDLFTRQAQEQLYHHDWPWNVGELENLFRNEGIRSRLRTLGQEKVELELVQDALGLEHRSGWLEVQPSMGDLPVPGLSYKGLDAWCEQRKAAYLARAFRAMGESVTDTARALGCSRDVIYKYLELAHQKPEAGAEVQAESEGAPAAAVGVGPGAVVATSGARSADPERDTPRRSRKTGQ